AAVAVFPFVELLLRSGRIASATFSEATANPVQSGDLGDLVLPPRSEITRDAGSARGGYLGTLAFGPLGLFLAAGCVAGFPGRRRLVLLLAVVAALGLLLSLGAPGLLTPLLWGLGPFRGVRFPARWFVFFHLFLAFAVGAGVDGWLYGRFSRRDEIPPGEEEEEDRAARAARLARRSAALAFGVVLLLALLPPASAASRDPVRAALVAAAAVVAALAVVAHRRLRGPGWLAGAVILAALAGSLLAVAKDPLEGVPAARLSSRPTVVDDVPPLAPGRCFTTASDPTLLFRATRPDGRFDLRSPLLSHEALAGYTNLQTGLASATSASPIPNPRLTRLLGAALAGGSATALLDLVDVRRLVTPFATSVPGARLARRTGGVFRYERSTALGRVFFAREARTAGDEDAFAALKEPGLDPEAVVYAAPSAATLPPRRSPRGYAVARVTTDLPEEVEIATMTSEPAVLVVTQSFDSGWTGRVDGAVAPLLRIDLALTGVVVPAGEHRVTLAYRPLSFRVGAIVSLASLLVLAGLVVAGKSPEYA
ncbi:MAG TPA: YfhO family protein, partial [Thermoanaerobaculia bacterium]|nr:YfhO family protein [Thermoanaerobaculia bacterium]